MSKYKRDSRIIPRNIWQPYIVWYYFSYKSYDYDEHRYNTYIHTYEKQDKFPDGNNESFSNFTDYMIEKSPAVAKSSANGNNIVYPLVLVFMVIFQIFM